MADEIPASRPAEAMEAADGRRNAWIVTGYGIFALTLLSLAAYTVAQYAVR